MNKKDYITLKGKTVLNIDILILILVDILLISQLKTPIHKLLITICVFDLIILFFLHTRFYYFAYNDVEIIVHHLWFKFTRKYNVSDIERIELVSIPYNGRSILIKTKTGKKRRFGAVMINKDALNKMVLETNNQIMQDKDR